MANLPISDRLGTLADEGAGVASEPKGQYWCGFYAETECGNVCVDVEAERRRATQPEYTTSGG